MIAGLTIEEVEMTGILFDQCGFTPSMDGVSLFLEMHETGAGLGIRMADENAVGMYRVDPGGEETLIYALSRTGEDVTAEYKRKSVVVEATAQPLGGIVDSIAKRAGVDAEKLREEMRP